MIITKYVMYKGRKKLVSELSHSCNYKVEVVCPKCLKTRTVFYKSLVMAGHHVCHLCMVKRHAKKLTEGEKYGRLVVLGISKRVGFSVCKCECGKIAEINNYNLKKEITKSCGCLKRESFNNVNRPKGEKHGRWKGGVSSERQRIASTKLYKDWKKAVFERDNYTCQKCKQSDIKINTHHIVTFKEGVELRVDVITE